MAAAVQCPRTLAVHFPSEIYRSTGASQVLPEFVKSLDLPNVLGIQLMPNGVVRVTYQEPAQCDAALTSGISFRGASLRIAPVDSRTRLVYVRDLPVEVPDDGLKVYLRAFGVVHSCSMQTYPAMPEVSTGTRVVKVTLAKDLPSSARVSVVLTSGFGIKASPKLVLSAGHMVTVSKIVPSTGCAVAAVSLGTWLVNVPSVVRPPFLKIPLPASTRPFPRMRMTRIAFFPLPPRVVPAPVMRKSSVQFPPLFWLRGPGSVLPRLLFHPTSLLLIFGTTSGPLDLILLILFPVRLSLPLPWLLLIL